MSEREQRPLDGIKVLDFSHVLAGPYCGRILCDLGAEVVKVEAPAGDVSRRLGARRAGISGYFMQQNCGKLNISIDLKKEDGRSLAERLVKTADVLIENFRPGVMLRAGLGPEASLAANRGLVYCSISGFGHQSSLRDRPAFAGIAHATTGTLYRQGKFHSHDPEDSVLAIGDTVSGLHSVIAILAALRLRESSGEGQFIDMAMHDALLSIQECAHSYLFGEDGTESDVFCSWVYRCGDEFVAMPSDPRANWDQLTAVMQRPELMADERYLTLEQRNACLDELEAHVQAWVADEASVDAVVEKLSTAGLPGARVLSLAEALDSGQVAERAMAPEMDDRSGSTCRVLNTPYRFSNARAGVRGRPAYRGEHNREVLERWLAAESDEIDALLDAGVLSDRLPSD